MFKEMNILKGTVLYLWVCVQEQERIWHKYFIYGEKQNMFTETIW